VRYSYKLDDCARRTTRLVGDKAHLFWRETPPDKEEADAKVIVAVKGEAVTPISVLPHVVDKTEEPAVYSLLERGLTSRDQDEMKAKVSEFCDSYLGGGDAAIE
jgi:hypothetical protein